MNRADLSKWDSRFLKLAEHIGAWSKGPRKRIGAVIVRPDRSIASLGYNGPPRGFDDEHFLKMTRDEQHRVVIHAEENAFLHLTDEDLSRMLVEPYTIYVSPLPPCEDCADIIIGIKIKRVVAYCGHISDDWLESAKEAEKKFAAAGVDCLFVYDESVK